jgi:hypothetical protein
VGEQIAITNDQVEDAWQAYAALIRCAAAFPDLAQNEYFIACQDSAFARFKLAFDALEVPE